MTGEEYMSYDRNIDDTNIFKSGLELLHVKVITRAELYSLF